MEYWDASALVKLAFVEPESGAAGRAFAGASRVASSRVGVIETSRAATRRGVTDAPGLLAALASLVIIELDEPIAATAARLGPTVLRTLDAIHLATALELRPELDAFVTYDERLAAAARDLGLPVVSPA